MTWIGSVSLRSRSGRRTSRRRRGPRAPREGRRRRRLADTGRADQDGRPGSRRMPLRQLCDGHAREALERGLLAVDRRSSSVASAAGVGTRLESEAVASMTVGRRRDRVSRSPDARAVSGSSRAQSLAARLVTASPTAGIVDARHVVAMTTSVERPARRASRERTRGSLCEIVARPTHSCAPSGRRLDRAASRHPWDAQIPGPTCMIIAPVLPRAKLTGPVGWSQTGGYSAAARTIVPAFAPSKRSSNVDRSPSRSGACSSFAIGLQARGP